MVLAFACFSEASAAATLCFAASTAAFDACQEKSLRRRALHSHHYACAAKATVQGGIGVLVLFLGLRLRQRRLRGVQLRFRVNDLAGGAATNLALGFAALL